MTPTQARKLCISTELLESVRAQATGSLIARYAQLDKIDTRQPQTTDAVREMLVIQRELSVRIVEADDEEAAEFLMPGITKMYVWELRNAPPTAGKINGLTITFARDVEATNVHGDRFRRKAGQAVVLEGGMIWPGKNLPGGTTGKWSFWSSSDMNVAFVLDPEDVAVLSIPDTRDDRAAYRDVPFDGVPFRVEWLQP